VADCIYCILDILSYPTLFLYQGANDHVRKGFLTHATRVFLRFMMLPQAIHRHRETKKHWTIDDVIPYDI